MVLKEILFINGVSFPSLKNAFIASYFTKMKTKVYKAEKNLPSETVTFSQPISVPTFIRIIIVVFILCLKLLLLRTHKIFGLTECFRKLNS